MTSVYASSLASAAREDRSDVLLDDLPLPKNQLRKENDIRRRNSRSLRGDLSSSRSRTGSRSRSRASASRSRCDSHMRKVKDTTQKKKDRGAQVSRRRASNWLGVEKTARACSHARDMHACMSYLHVIPVSDLERRSIAGVLCILNHLVRAEGLFGGPQVAHTAMHACIHRCWKRTWAVAAMRAYTAVGREPGQSQPCMNTPLLEENMGSRSHA